ncbi:MAG: Ig-like domain-containing protein [Clostridia bacterium]|nr:Ig-like domain-containing protein [Clostridia bacterium]
MKRRMGILLILCMLIASCLPAHAAGTYQVSIAPNGLLLAPGQTKSLSVSISPVNLMNHTVIWTSSNEYIATVTSGGKVTGHAAGRAVITATIDSGDRAQIIAEVTGNPVTEVTIIDSDIELLLGESVDMNYSINSDASDQRVKWMSDDTNVATVDGNGRVTAVGYGTAILTLTAVNGMTANATIYVPSEVNSIMLDPPDAMLSIGDTLQLDAYVFPGNARDRSLTWSSSDENVVQVNQSGFVTAIGNGACTIRATAVNGVYAQAEIAVKKIPKTLRLTENAVALSREVRTHQLEAVITPDSAADCALAWSSSDESVVNVRDGRLTAAGYGRAVVTVVSENGLSDQCQVYVGEPPESIQLSQEKYVLEKNGSGVQAEILFTPEDAYEGGIQWKIGDEHICTVDESGLLTPVAYGLTTVTATTASGLTAQAEVRVTGDIEKIAFERNSYLLLAHNSYTAEIVSVPEDVKPAELYYSSSNPDVCAIIDGVLYARRPGTAIISAKTADGKLTCEAGVTVDKNPSIATKYICLTFDNGPTENTPRILDVLRAYDADSTFFLLGASVSQRPETAELFKDTDHEIGNHTYNNTSLNHMSLEDIATHIQYTDMLIQNAAGRKPTVLRAPDANLSVKLFTSFLDTRRFVGWSADVGDMLSGRTAEDIFESAYAARYDTAILVFHDAAAETAKALELLLPALILDGYDFVTVSELIEITGSTNQVFTTSHD